MKKFILLFAVMCLFYGTVSAKNLETNYRSALVMAYSPTNSVFENDDIKLEIYNESLYATNKTDRTIFLDLSQCFLVHNGTSYPMLSEKHADDKTASKNNVSTAIDTFISIAPSTGSKQNETFICDLAGGFVGDYTTSETPQGEFSEYDERLLTLLNELVNESLEGDPKGKNYLGTASRHLTEDESVNNIGASLAYAFNKRSEDWTPVTISTWVSDVYFVPFYVEMPVDLSKKEKRGFGVKKTESAKIHLKADSPFEFDQDKSPIIVRDWTGDFKKGTFSLYPTRIAKEKGKSLGKGLLKGLAILTTGGLGAAAFNNPEKIYYKSSIIFDGENSNWGKMSYLNNTDLSQFNNKR